MSVGQAWMAIVAATMAVILAAFIIGESGSDRRKPEQASIGTVGCPIREIAVALAGGLTQKGANTKQLRKWGEQNGCNLVQAGTTITPIEEEAGHAKVTKVSANGDVVYLIGLPRPARVGMAK